MAFAVDLMSGTIYCTVSLTSRLYVLDVIMSWKQFPRHVLHEVAVTLFINRCHLAVTCWTTYLNYYPVRWAEVADGTLP